MRTPPPRDYLRFSNTTGILHKKAMWFIGGEVEQETSAPPPEKNPGSASENHYQCDVLTAHGSESFRNWLNRLISSECFCQLAVACWLLPFFSLNIASTLQCVDMKPMKIIVVFLTLFPV